MIVVLDSHVWVSALEFGGAPALALTQALTIDRLAISDFIEHAVVLALTRKFHREPRALQVVMEEFLQWAHHVEIQPPFPRICRDPNDDPILATAVAAPADLLIAGDRDLLSLKSFQGIGIVTPAEYLRVSFAG